MYQAVSLIAMQVVLALASCSDGTLLGGSDRSRDDKGATKTIETKDPPNETPTSDPDEEAALPDEPAWVLLTSLACAWSEPVAAELPVSRCELKNAKPPAADLAHLTLRWQTVGAETEPAATITMPSLFEASLAMPARLYALRSVRVEIAYDGVVVARRRGALKKLLVGYANDAFTACMASASDASTCFVGIPTVPGSPGDTSGTASASPNSSDTADPEDQQDPEAPAPGPSPSPGSGSTAPKGLRIPPISSTWQGIYAVNKVGGCHAPNPYTGACSCPVDTTTATIMRFIDSANLHPIGSGIGFKLVLCVAPNGATDTEFGGAFTRLETKTAKTCVDKNPYTDDCACLSGTTASATVQAFSVPDGASVAGCIDPVAESCVLKTTACFRAIALGKSQYVGGFYQEADSCVFPNAAMGIPASCSCPADYKMYPVASYVKTDFAAGAACGASGCDFGIRACLRED